MNKGFTLIELLVVVLIIGIISAIAVPKYTKVTQRARAVQLVMHVKNIASAQQRLYATNAVYTSDIDGLDIVLGNGYTITEYPTGKRYESDKYTYQIHDSEGKVAVYSKKEDYWISWSSNDSQFKDRLFCIGYTTKAKELCANIGGKYSENPDRFYLD